MTHNPLAIGIMIEGQEGLNWPRFFRLVDAVEALGGYSCAETGRRIR